MASDMSVFPPGYFGLVVAGAAHSVVLVGCLCQLVFCIKACSEDRSKNREGASLEKPTAAAAASMAATGKNEVTDSRCSASKAAGKWRWICQSLATWKCQHILTVAWALFCIEESFFTASFYTYSSCVYPYVNFIPPVMGSNGNIECVASLTLGIADIVLPLSMFTLMWATMTRFQPVYGSLFRLGRSGMARLVGIMYYLLAVSMTVGLVGYGVELRLNLTEPIDYQVQRGGPIVEMLAGITRQWIICVGGFFHILTFLGGLFYIRRLLAELRNAATKVKAADAVANATGGDLVMNSRVTLHPCTPLPPPQFQEPMKEGMEPAISLLRAIQKMQALLSLILVLMALTGMVASGVVPTWEVLGLVEQKAVMVAAAKVFSAITTQCLSQLAVVLGKLPTRARIALISTAMEMTPTPTILEAEQQDGSDWKSASSSVAIMRMLG